ncbi:acyl-CoA dehydrogenase family protein [Glutamicibacter arilaitensis]|uniref:Acyl-CoA dehydrogenase n=2 Tax=Glutamicibacter arilaitensis TaxID=256701 RepID=A0A2N7S1P5_9MICC|nr:MULTISPECIES: acyl-CoA dehydrogenase family protein [Glutamicibacter]PMQ20061.1 acyl-CoA dehydrogenase [Glutamicibacter arilaitensis]CBT76862.1 putative acyl-CoA dehydrogenase [Glutamicibacter arilaitensis Re117]HCH48905.1 acyl-CoA dehydrogenase [Glutamicibacter sp.]
MTQPETGFEFPAGVVEPEYDLWSGDVNIDPTGVFAEVGEADNAWRAKARKFILDEVKKNIHEYWDKADYPLHLIKKLGDADLLRDGLNLEGYEQMSPLAAGLVNMEMARGDGSVSTIVGVQGGLAVRSVLYCGSDEQIQKYALPMLRGELPGAFALTEPTHGSDSVSLETRAAKVQGGYRLSGEKKWIGNGSIGGVSIVWARDEQGKVRGFIVHQDAEGYSATTIENKLSLRAIWQAHIRMENVFVPDEDVMPNAQSFKDTSRVLFATRLGVAWSAVGHATACYESAVNYAKQRVQFGRPLAQSQIVQERLARMQSELATMQVLVMQATKREGAGDLTGPQASLAKYTATRTARVIASNARDLLGGNGILTSNRVARHFADVEAIHTYEGTETVQALIMGRDITGFSAFA